MADSKKILVTGGAGYIGSHTVKLLQEQGKEVIVLDNLSTGHARAISCPLIVGDLADAPLLDKIFKEYEIDSVIHFAGSLIVEESVLFPEKYFQNNVVNGLNLLNAMKENGVKKIVFSSTCAVYGEPHYMPLDENHPKLPINPYGESKLMFEKILKWYGQAHDISSAILRYFNASGAHPDGTLGEDKANPSHLIPRVLAVANRQSPAAFIYGNDYPTSDGTCVRDYIHVCDLALAHARALEKLENSQGSFTYNVGTGRGTSVQEMITAVTEITGKMVPIEYAPKRPGDPAKLVADPTLAREDLGFEPQFSSLEIILGTAWAWYKQLQEQKQKQER